MGQEYKFCKHCDIKYIFIISGIASLYNDPNYCNACKKVIDDALIKIPKRAERRFVKCTGISREEFFEALEKIPVDLHKNWTGIDTGKDIQIIKGAIINGSLYRATYWEKEIESKEFFVEIEQYHEL